MRNPYDNDWRSITAAIYKKPRDSKVFGSVELDVTDLEQYVTEKRNQKLKITLTHVMLLILARGVHKDVPELNCYVRRGRIIPRSSVDVSLTVLGTDGNLSSIKVHHAERLTLAGLLESMQHEVALARKGQGDHIRQARGLLPRIPWPFREKMADFVRWITIDLGLPLPFLGVDPNSFGSFVLSNLGSIGLDIGYPALAPFSNVSMVVTQGTVTSKPVVYKGEITIRRMLTMSAAVDHRVVDAMHIGKLFLSLRRQLKHPEQLEHPLED
ncbi:MAG: 2-oxo acid dehydrogenase subunit E2 [Saprospiraceae bacterium]|nr:2-oxo acid dehydrogenase subunit E2 [Saprospiraceae bacterium]